MSILSDSKGVVFNGPYQTGQVQMVHGPLQAIANFTVYKIENGFLLQMDGKLFACETAEAVASQLIALLVAERMK